MKTIQIKNGDIKFNISYFQAESAIHKVVLISPATGVKKHVYIKLANYLNQAGFDVITWDWRGISDNLVGKLKHDQSIMQDWAKQDLNAVINWAADYFPNEKLYAIGHSFGGQAFGMAKDIEKLQAIVTVATQSGYWKHWPIRQRYQFAALWYGVMPLLTHSLGFFPSKKLGLGENLPKGVALQWATWGRNPEYMADYAGHEKMTQNILAFYFTDDSFAPKAAVTALHQHYRQCQIRFREISPDSINVDQIGHFGFFKQHNCQPLWDEVIDFFKRE